MLSLRRQLYSGTSHPFAFILLSAASTHLKHLPCKRVLYGCCTHMHIGRCTKGARRAAAASDERGPRAPCFYRSAAAADPRCQANCGLQLPRVEWCTERLYRYCFPGTFAACSGRYIRPAVPHAERLCRRRQSAAFSWCQQAGLGNVCILVVVAPQLKTQLQTFTFVQGDN